MRLTNPEHRAIAAAFECASYAVLAGRLTEDELGCSAQALAELERSWAARRKIAEAKAWGGSEWPVSLPAAGWTMLARVAEATGELLLAAKLEGAASKRQRRVLFSKSEFDRLLQLRNPAVLATSGYDTDEPVAVLNFSRREISAVQQLLRRTWEQTCRTPDWQQYLKPAEATVHDETLSARERRAVLAGLRDLLGEHKFAESEFELVFAVTADQLKALEARLTNEPTV